MKIEQAELDARTVLGVREVVKMTELTEFFARAFAAAATELAKQGNHPAGPPVAIYSGQPTDMVTVTAGFPAIRPANPAQPPDATAGLVLAELPGGPAVTAIHIGSYDQLSTSYSKISAWMMEHQVKPTNQMWEEYLVGPDTVSDPALWQTRIVFPIN
jgi:effector-binding domain-containing protein